MTLENNGMALQGLKILDTSQLFAGAMPATLMGDFGAEVIKVEHPKNGDGLRTMGSQKDGIPLSWKFHSRNKKCITLNLGSPEGAEILKRLVKDTDILIEGFRPGTMERWGIGYEDLKAVNPDRSLQEPTGLRHLSRGHERIHPRHRPTGRPSYPSSSCPGRRHSRLVRCV